MAEELPGSIMIKGSFEELPAAADDDSCVCKNFINKYVYVTKQEVEQKACLDHRKIGAFIVSSIYRKKMLVDNISVQKFS